METALSKIRHHTGSSLPHQKTPATLLVALESALDEQKAERTPTAYFAGLLTTLEGTLQKNDRNVGEGDVLPAELYLLAFVAPFVPTPVIRTNLETILTLTSPLFPLLSSHAPPLRSQLSLYQVVFTALDRSQLEVDGVRQAFASILQLCLDPRPKVRKKSAEVVQQVLQNPPAPLLRHTYAERVADWVRSILTQASNDPIPKNKFAKTHVSNETAIHTLAFLRPILPHLPATSLPAITSNLLTLPRLGNPYLSQSAYSILADLFSAAIQDSSSGVDQKIPDVLTVVISSPPVVSDATLAPAWLSVVGNCMHTFSTLDPAAAAAEVGKVWEKTWSYLEAKEPATRQAAVECLELSSHSFSPNFVHEATKDPSSKCTLIQIIAQTTKALDTLSFARSMPELMAVISILIISLRHRDSSTSPTAAEILLLPIVAKVGELRTQRGFEYKEAADSTLSTAMRVLGPHVILQILPLNLEPDDRQAGREPRAYILPLLAQPHSSPLGHFVSYFVPLSERMFDLQQKAETEGRQSEAKVWSVLVSQIWSGLAGYCHASVDLPQALTPAFSQLLSQLLYSQPELRPSILRALKVIIDSNVVAAASDKPASADGSIIITAAEAAANVTFLRAQVESWLAVLFNVFGSVEPDVRGMVGDVISAWTSIADEQQITQAYAKVIQLLTTNLQSSQANVTTMTEDILVLLLPYLSSVDSAALFEFCLSPDVIGARDNGIQKRGYKILARLTDRGKFPVNAEDVLQRLDAVSNKLTSAAKKDRFMLLIALVQVIRPESLHLIPSFIPEAVLGTKEPSEKAREAAFDLIVKMGNKMNSGGLVKRGMMEGMDEDTATEAKASVDEFITMMAGGLAGATPHTISATITAISRLVFEFKDAISPNIHTEILSTILVFLTSANREIVKSALGYMKLAIHTLPVDLVRPHLKDLVHQLLAWSHDHKNHFKVKVRHIFERMIRRFGWDAVYACAEGEDSSKVLLNIKKRKDRAKRKRANKDQEENELPTSAKPATGTAFEDVLYGSESELSDSDEEDAGSRQPGKTKAKTSRGAQLRVDDDEPMDLLSGAASRITNTQNKRRRQPGHEASLFNTDDAGKLVIESSDDEAADNQQGEDVVGTAYHESLTSVDGFTRGPKGQVKFNKDTKKRRREADERDQDVEMADPEAAQAKPPKNKKKTDVRPGQEFKAKNAGGDVKKGGVDPYAYLSLSQAAKKGQRGRTGVGIAGKRTK
ncbi:ribosomal RNA-processing protein 12 [Pleurotus eryngii]|uniref:Ribosomal RNA-processing protein 12 n=1 Tax=Pleurotus eryngii TaxID=5323 RepID=A0A9P6A9U8_PLEER|nr:ribosomal RNA-processing protein 12 [Pleurotus eryngii]